MFATTVEAANGHQYDVAFDSEAEFRDFLDHVDGDLVEVI